jgi:isopenicillin-N N-acyltransferase-like protein
LRSEIQNQLSIYRSMFLVTSSLSWPSVLSVASEFQATIHRLTPNIHEEMLGIAQGAEVDILDIVALNCRSEIALGSFSDGCTSMAWVDSSQSRMTKTVLAQNWDWVKIVKENLVMMSIEQVGKPKIWMVTEVSL